jgi:IS1 family transposase
MTILDATNNLIINEKVVDGEDFNKTTIKKFLTQSLDGLNVKAIITDGYQAYPSIIESLSSIHHEMCLPQNANTNEKSNKNIKQTK